MEFWNRENIPREPHPAALPPLPQVWIGYLLGVATIVAEIVAVELHPEIAKDGITIPPLYLFLSAFVGGVYWLVCVYQYHVVLAQVAGWKHPISPARCRISFYSPLQFLLGFQVAAGNRAFRELAPAEASHEATVRGDSCVRRLHCEVAVRSWPWFDLAVRGVFPRVQVPAPRSCFAGVSSGEFTAIHRMIWI
jgi:hypothetical protein